jgi:valyl-tRNA synthetase
VALKANKIGSECFRLWKACDAQVGDDFHINPEEIEQKYFGVLTKVFNVARFASQFDVPEDLNTVPASLEPEDRWILAEHHKVMATAKEAWVNLDIYSATQALKNFLTGVLPSHWLEMVKTRLYAEDTTAAWVLHRVVRDTLTAFSPVCPFFTHHITTTVYGTSCVDAQEFPAHVDEALGVGTDEGEALRKLTADLTTFNSLVWSTKREQGIALNQPIEGMALSESLEPFRPVLTSMHRLA